MSPTFNSVARWQQNVDQMRLFAAERPAADHTPFSRPLWVERDFRDQPQSARPGFRRAANQWQAAPRWIPGDATSTIFPSASARRPGWGIPFRIGKPGPCGLVGEHCARGIRLEILGHRAWILAPNGGRQVMTIRPGPPARPSSATATGDEATVVGYGGNANNKHITTYFRKSFELTDVARFRSLSISLLVDDGAVAYLNGQEIARVNMPSDAFSTRYRPLRRLPMKTAFSKFQVSPALLEVRRQYSGRRGPSGRRRQP